MSALLIAGCSALVIGGIPPAAAAQSGGPDQNETSQAAEQYKNNKSTWEWIADTFCDLGNGPALDPRPDKDSGKTKAAGTNRKAAQDQFGDTAIEGYYKAYRITPVNYAQDPVVETRTIVFSEPKSWAPPAGFSDADELRLWRYLMCSNEQFRAEWAATLKTQQEKFAKKLKAEENGQILEYYNKKMAAMVKVLKDEQKRLGIAPEARDN
ncbi:hypothetical protein [Nocardia pseudobrasiliensis]|nr:hypothetical protein [Nocardia pseudobrasiliensis]